VCFVGNRLWDSEGARNTPVVETEAKRKVSVDEVDVDFEI
jgi:hypothetical protein